MTTLSALAQGWCPTIPTAIHLSRGGFDDLATVCDDLIGDDAQAARRAGADARGRVDVIGGGAIIVEELARELGSRAGIDELVVSEHDILDGIALVDCLTTGARNARLLTGRLARPLQQPHAQRCLPYVRWRLAGCRNGGRRRTRCNDTCNRILP